jgi:ABC-type transporter Mla subunit MlaD
MPSTRARGLARLAIAAAIVAVLVVLVANSNDSELIIFGSTPSYPHELQILAPSAFEVIPGERVVEGGVGIGTILSANVTRNAQAHVVFGLSDQAWPVPTNSTFTLRMGGTVKFTDRFLNITKGTASTDFRDNAYVPATQFTVPVEYDQIFNIFDAQGRAGLKGFFDNTGRLAPAAPSFRRAIAVAPPVLNQAAAVFGDLGYDQQALSTLVSSTATVSDAIAASNPGLGTLIQGGANTFHTIAMDNRKLGVAVNSGYTGMKAIARLGGQALVTLPLVQKLAERLDPGVTQLGDLAGPLDVTLHKVISVEPTAVATLDTVKDRGPAIDSLLTAAKTTLMPELTSVGNQAAPELYCIRPYTPSIIGFFLGWGGFFSLGLNNPHVNLLHSVVSLLPFPNGTTLSSGQLTKIFPDLHVSQPAAAGENVDQPIYSPRCNVNPTDTNPADDPETGTHDPYSGIVVPYAHR